MSSRGDSWAPILVGASLGSVATLLMHCVTTKQKEEAVEQTPVVKQQPRSAPKAHLPTSLPADFRAEQISRHTLYFGDDGMESLRQARICVVGLGGVGSHTAHMLARGGVGYLRLIDFDQVTLSSLNRHACATLHDVGRPKVTCLVDFLKLICPDPEYLALDGRVAMLNHETSQTLLETDQPWSLVIDAIDDIPTKAHLLQYCLSRQIPVLSCMGAGGKSDPTRLHVSDLQTAARDPLATKLRQSLKKHKDLPDDYLSDMDQLSIVYSSEKTVAKLAEFTDEQKKKGVHNYGAVDGMRIRVLPVLGTLPAIMGQTLAAVALCRLGNKVFQPVTGERVGRSVRHKLLQHLRRREETIFLETLKDGSQTYYDSDDGKVVNGVWIGPLQVDMDDVEYLMEIWRNRCAVTGARIGAVLEFTRWDLAKPSTCDNLVLMSRSALEKYDTPAGKETISPETRKTIEARLASCRVDRYA